MSCKYLSSKKERKGKGGKQAGNAKKKTENPRVGSSILSLGTKKIKGLQQML
jgi:hypothetical protein